MGYREIILIVLQLRSSIICNEDHLRSDFTIDESSKNDIVDWCKKNQILYKKLSKRRIMLKISN